MKINRTVDRAMKMLDLVANSPQGLSLNEISEMLEAPKSSCYDILHTLVNSNILEPIGRDGKSYRIGVKAFVIGNKYMQDKRILEIARDKIEMIGEKYGKSVFIGEDCLEHVVYIYKFQPKDISIVASCAVGAKNAYYNTALGKCMLAFKDNFIELSDTYYEQKLILDKEKFLSQIIGVHRNKCAYSDQEHQKQLFCIAVPIFDHLGNVTMALSMSGLYVDDERCQEETEDLQKAAKEISRQLGYIGDY